jgi:hypothetical protein
VDESVFDMALLYRVKMPLEDIRNLKIGIRAKL